MLGSNSRKPSDGELAAFADGSLTGRRRARVEELVGSSPELGALVDEQRRALAMVHAAAVPAPPSLRARVPGDVGAQRARSAPPRRPILATAAALCAVAAVAIVVLLTVGSSAPTVADAARLALEPPTAAAPTGNVGPVLPQLHAAGLAYPYWEDRFDWRATGVRWDSIGGRKETTVFYRHNGRGVGYTIVSGPFLALPANAPTVTLHHTRVSLLSLDGRTVAVWARAGHTCILSGAGVPGGVLVKLAAWE